MAVTRGDADQVGGPDTFVLHSRVATTVKYIAHFGKASKNSQGMTHIIPQWGSATGAIVRRQIDGGTDLAFAKPRTRFTTIPYNRKVLGYIIGQGCPNLGPVERPS
ncbi:hypothetical protein SNOG_13290 [Parastagonospora nodorum SN15]|uniref:Uncharacterized protein n=1 Tax=Phaeosphaeria nodorum (strain SN15 / ATCC MYA-4574 / FGSC 10173) TaxID=321614 RepID=Q0U4M4_PHANO|nr:hypothetical protein SNOG_13290 [Parastagonospora nodorum SN15]EAT79174.1 hypothetical protein SNOG_13290 [Parastagonospora nodorum SN15]